MVREVEAALDAGAIGLSSGLIYAPGMHADPDEVAALVDGRHAPRWPVRHAHAQRGRRALRGRSTESIGTIRAAADAGVDAPRLQVSHLKCGVARRVGSGRRGGRGCSRRRAPRASTLPPTSTRTRPRPRPWRRSCRQRCSGSGVEACVAALGDHEVRDRVDAEIERGISGWENVAADPGWAGIRISYARQPSRLGRALARGAR